MTSFLLCAALALAGSLEPMLDLVEQEPAEIALSAQLVPSDLDLEVVWLPEEPGQRDGGHWIPPLRLGVTEKVVPDWPCLAGTDSFRWTDQLERDYYLPTSGRFARQVLPFEIGLRVEASGGQSLAVQVDLWTSVVQETDVKTPASLRMRKRTAQGQMLVGQALVIS